MNNFLQCLQSAKGTQSDPKLPDAFFARLGRPLTLNPRDQPDTIFSVLICFLIGCLIPTESLLPR